MTLSDVIETDNNSMKKLLKDKVAGALIGLAVGDSK